MIYYYYPIIKTHFSLILTTHFELVMQISFNKLGNKFETGLLAKHTFSRLVKPISAFLLNEIISFDSSHNSFKFFKLRKI